MFYLYSRHLLYLYFFTLHSADTQSFIIFMNVTKLYHAVYESCDELRIWNVTIPSQLKHVAQIKRHCIEKENSDKTIYQPTWPVSQIVT